MDIERGVYSDDDDDDDDTFRRECTHEYMFWIYVAVGLRINCVWTLF